MVLKWTVLEKKEVTANRAAVTESQFNDFTFFTAVLSYGILYCLILFHRRFCKLLTEGENRLQEFGSRF